MVHPSSLTFTVFPLKTLAEYNPFSGDYRGTVVRNNTIRGGFANSPETASEQKGDNNVTVMIK
jgi:hypothetical protein